MRQEHQNQRYEYNPRVSSYKRMRVRLLKKQKETEFERLESSLFPARDTEHSKRE